MDFVFQSGSNFLSGIIKSLCSYKWPGMRRESFIEKSKLVIPPFKEINNCFEDKDELYRCAQHITVIKLGSVEAKRKEISIDI